MPDYREKIFKMLNIKPNQIFELYDEEHKAMVHLDYYFDKNLVLYVDITNKQSAIELKDIVIGKYRIIKKVEFTDEELAAINYAKALGCKWLAKDENNSVWAFIDKPVKSKKFDWWEYPDDDTNQECYEIKIPLSFLHWEDKEPYKI